MLLGPWLSIWSCVSRELQCFDDGMNHVYLYVVRVNRVNVKKSACVFEISNIFFFLNTIPTVFRCRLNDTYFSQ